VLTRCGLGDAGEKLHRHERPTLLQDAYQAFIATNVAANVLPAGIVPTTAYGRADLRDPALGPDQTDGDLRRLANTI